MSLRRLVLLVILTCSDAANLQDPDVDCQDCNENGPWWPLFKPSQIIHSEFPEHAQYRSQEHTHPQAGSQEHAHPHSVSQEHVYLHSGSQEHAYPLSGSQEILYSHSGSKEHAYPLSETQEQAFTPSRSQENLEDKLPSLPPRVVDIGSRQVDGIDSPVKSYSGSRGEHLLEWDHYGDIKTVATVAYNSLEDRSGNNHPSREDRSDLKDKNSSQGHRRESVHDQDTSASVISQEANSFFEEGSFFDEKPTSPKDKFPDDFEVTKEYTYSKEHHQHHDNSLEGFNSHESFGRYKKPVATSFASISSVFKTRPIIKSRDLLHSNLSFNDISHYIKSQLKNPLYGKELLNGKNVTKQYRVREPQSEGPGVLHINHVVQGPSPMLRARNNLPPPRMNLLGSRPSSFVPVDHPVYRYVKLRGGSDHHYRKPPISRASTLRWEDVHPQLRSKFPFKYLQPQVQVQNHQTFVQHVVPTKDPFSDNFWKESQKIENLKPPPLGQTVYLYKKKQTPLDVKNIARRRQSPGFVYIIKRNKRLHK